MLPAEELKPLYDKLAWLYIYNDFKGGPADLAADRVRMRFNVSSWPQLLLVDPVSLKVVGSTGRTTDSFLKAAASARISEANAKQKKTASEAFRKADARAEKLQTAPSVELARAGLRSRDVVEQSVAVNYLAEHSPNEILAQADRLLQVPNDLLRYAVCRVVTDSADTVKIPRPLVLRLETLARQPRGSQNPNVLRIRAVEALGRCSLPSSIAVIAPFARGPLNNGLTGVAIRSLGQIGEREPRARAEVTKILLDCFPEIPAALEDERLNAYQTRRVTGLARTIHQSLSALTTTAVAFPAEYTADSRAELIESLRAALEASP